MNAVLLNFLFIKEIKRCSATVFNTDNIKKCFFEHQISMISEGSVMKTILNWEKQPIKKPISCYNTNESFLKSKAKWNYEDRRGKNRIRLQGRRKSSSVASLRTFIWMRSDTLGRQVEWLWQHPAKSSVVDLRETSQFSSKGIIFDFIGNLDRTTVLRLVTESADTWFYILTHTKHDYKPLNYSIVIQNTYTMSD